MGWWWWKIQQSEISRGRVFYLFWFKWRKSIENSHVHCGKTKIDTYVENINFSKKFLLYKFKHFNPERNKSTRSFIFGIYTCFKLKNSSGQMMPVPPPSLQMNLYIRTHQKVQKLYLKSEQKKRPGKKKIRILMKVIFLWHKRIEIAKYWHN